MESIKRHLDMAYAQLVGMTVRGEAIMPVGVAMAHMTYAMAEILDREKKEKERAAGQDNGIQEEVKKDETA